MRVTSALHKLFVRSLVVFMALGAGMSASAWTVPGYTPSGGNALPPVNQSGTTQTKAGTLNILGSLGIGAFVPPALLSGGYTLSPDISLPWIEQSVFTSNTTSHAVAMPPTVVAGDLLLLLFTNDGWASVTTPAGWTLLTTQSLSDWLRGSVYAKVATGAEGGTTVDFVTSATETAAAQVFRISVGTWYGSIAGGIEVELAPYNNLTETAPALAPSWGLAKTFWVLYAAKSSGIAITGYPAGYTGVLTNTGNSTAGATVASARKLEYTPNVPAADFSVSGSGGSITTFTIAVRPKSLGVGANLTELQVSGGGVCLGSNAACASPSQTVSEGVLYATSAYIGSRNGGGAAWLDTVGRVAGSYSRYGGGGNNARMVYCDVNDFVMAVCSSGEAPDCSGYYTRIVCADVY